MAKLNADQALDLALHHHSVGRLHEAERIYREVLRADPGNADALHFLGVVAHQGGKHEDAVNWIRQAIERGAGADAWNNLGESLRALNKTEEATDAYRKAVAADPDHAEAHSNLGLMLLSDEKIPEAVEMLTKAVALSPSLANAHYNLGLARRREGRLDDAIAEWRRTLVLEPKQKLAMNNLGAALTEKWENPEEAVRVLEDTVALDPNFADAHANLSTALLGVLQYDLAIKSARRAVELDPKRAEAHNALGMALFQAKRYEEAVEAFRDAATLRERFQEAFTNLAAAYEMVGKMDEWVKVFESQVRDFPDDADGVDTLATIYRNTGRLKEAVEVAERALKMRPYFPEAHFNRGLTLLTMGDYIEGFKEYEWRWKCKDFGTPPRDFGVPQWEGGDPRGRTILVTAEQGFGDVLEFARYLPMLADRGATVLVESWPALAELLASVRGVSKVVQTGEFTPPFEMHVGLLSLPRLFGTTMETIPQNIPYMSADPERLARFKKRMNEDAAERFKVGLVWGGRIKPDPRRSASLLALGPLAQVPGVAFFSLQKGDPVEQLKFPPPGMEIIDLGKDCETFADSAAAVQNLDLLITIDSAPAHLGGAVGARTWTMLPLTPDWRWGRDREDCPWYPTMRLFRQPGPRDWDSVVAKIKVELEKLVKQRK